MTGPRSGLAHLQMQELTQALADACSAWQAHRKRCYDCRRAQDDTARWCDEGFRLAQADRRAYAALDAWARARLGEQGQLFPADPGG